MWFKAGTWANCPGLGICEQYAVKMQATGTTDTARHGVKIVYNHDLACAAFEKKST